MKTIRWGILGTGTVAGLFAEALHGLADARLEAVGSRSQTGAEAFARAFGVPRAHGSYEALAADRDVDVVYVATPNTLHKENCILALEAGKAVLCEKPFAVTGEEARAIVAVARRTGRFCMEGMWTRFVPIVRELVRLVGEGAIGDLRLVTATLGFPFAFDAKHRVFDPELGGGATLDLGVYGLSFALQFLGRPSDVVAQAVIGETGVDEQVAALLTFPGERQALIAAGLRCPMGNDASIAGSEGIIRLREPLYCPESATLVRTRARAAGVREPPRRRRWSAVKDHPLLRDLYARIVRARTEVTLVRRRSGNGYAHEALEVMRCVAAGAPESLIMPLDESIAIIETVDALRGTWQRARSRKEQ